MFGEHTHTHTGSHAHRPSGRGQDIVNDKSKKELNEIFLSDCINLQVLWLPLQSDYTLNNASSNKDSIRLLLVAFFTFRDL